VGLLIDRLTGRTRHVVEIVALVVGTFFAGFFAWYAVKMTWQSYVFNDISQGVIAVPLWIPQAGVVVGLIILTIALADEFVVVLRGGEAAYMAAERQLEAQMEHGE
jgi:TRAP-type C4-dicarboxylate transport system permease small subunit